MISIIIPVYNTAEYLNKCVASLVDQSYTDTEILLVDDGSTDQSGTMCDDWSKKDSRIRVIHKENGGSISAWKRGASEAKGDYLMFVDSDDWLDTNMLSEMVEFCSPSVEKEIISSDYVIERKQKDDTFTQEYVYQTLSPGVYEGSDLEEKVIPNLLGNEHRYVTVSRCMKLISRNLFLENMDYTDNDIRMGEDLAVILPSLYDCQRLVIMDYKAYYHYLLLPSSMAHKYDAGMYDNFIHLEEICQKVIHDKFASRPAIMEEQLANLNREFIHWLLLCVKNESRGNPAGYKKNICQLNLIRQDLIKEYPVSVKDLSNRLLYWTLKKPSRLRLGLLRLAMILYYR